VAVTGDSQELDVYSHDLPMLPVASTKALAVKLTMSPVGRQ